MALLFCFSSFLQGFYYYTVCNKAFLFSISLVLNYQGITNCTFIKCVCHSIDVRDATAKALYGRLFGWIVNKVNQLLAPPMASRGEEVTEIGTSDGLRQRSVDCKRCLSYLALAEFSFTDCTYCRV